MCPDDPKTSGPPARRLRGADVAAPSCPVNPSRPLAAPTGASDSNIKYSRRLASTPTGFFIILSSANKQPQLLFFLRCRQLALCGVGWGLGFGPGVRPYGALAPSPGGGEGRCRRSPVGALQYRGMEVISFAPKQGRGALDSSRPTHVAAQLERTVKDKFPHLWEAVRAQVLLARRVAGWLEDTEGTPSAAMIKEMRIAIDSVQGVLVAEVKANPAGKPSVADLMNRGIAPPPL